MRRIFTLFTFAMLSIAVNSQVCTINYGVSGTGIYPDTLPDGVVGQAYNQDVTFFMPLDTMGYDFTNFKIQSVSLPIGLTWQCSNNTNGCNYDPQVSQYGCVNIQGTPLLAGIYNVDVQVLADLSIVSGYPFSFQIYMEVLPNVVNTTNDGFSMLGSTGCSPVTVNFTNNNPGLVAYSWDFGNGNTSTAENPAPQVYTTPGDYVVHYEAYNSLANIDVYTLTGLDVTAMSNYGGGTFGETADAYFILKENGTNIYQSTFYLDQDPPVSWATNIILNPLNTYLVEVWEADETAGEPYFFGDDYMGVHTLNLTGCNGCAAGTSTINYQINHQIIYPTPFVVSADTVHVYDFPAVPLISYDQATLTLSTPDLGLAYQWYYEGVPIAGATSSSYVIDTTGNYSVAAVNSAGCATSSTTLNALFCDPSIQPVISIGPGGFLFVSNFPEEYDVEWTVNGVAIIGATNDTIIPTAAGGYAAVVSDGLGCEYFSPNFNLNLGIDENTVLNWNVYPNPSDHFVTVELNGNQLIEEVQLIDLSGRIVKNWWWNDEVKMTLEIDEIPSGYFMLKLVNGATSWTKRLVIQ